MPEEVIEFGEPEIHEEGGVYGFEWKNGDNPMMRVMVSDVRNDGDSIYGEFTVWWLLNQPMGVRPIQPRTTLKLNSSHSTGWRSIPRELGKRFPNVDIEGAMTIVVDEIINRFTQGSPTVALHEQERTNEPPFLLEPWVSSSGNTIIYGEGGLSKSLITLGMAISISTGVPIFGKEPLKVGPVIIFDYEDDHQTHTNRLHAICRSFGIPVEEAKVYHHALSAKVSTAHREMRARVVETGSVLGILDSVGMGRGGSAVAAEDTIRMFRNLRSMSVPFLSIDHISKASKEAKGGEADAYGSIYTMNSARLGWSLTRQHTNDDRIVMQAVNTKHNHVPKQRTQLITVEYKNDANGVPEFIDIEVGNELGMVIPAVGTHERMMMLLSHGEWMTYKQLTESLGLGDSTIRSEVHRDKDSPDPDFEVRGKPGMPSEVRCCKIVATPHATPLDDDWDDREIQ